KGKKAYVYIGIAADETKRLEKPKQNWKLHPLADWGITEKQALEICYNNGVYWNENGIRLYDILDRVSCWCCCNKNLKELKNIYTYLPQYWKRLEAMQSSLDRPMKGNGKSVFELRKRFDLEDNHE
ncbi:MAG: phosphoadenosine phosphosulfate reductase, partial [Ruthenibacterium sp.]